MDLTQGTQGEKNSRAKKMILWFWILYIYFSKSQNNRGILAVLCSLAVFVVTIQPLDKFASLILAAQLV